MEIKNIIPLTSLKKENDKLFECDASLNCMKKRYILTIYSFFGFFLAYALRVNLSVAIIEMVNSKSNAHEELNSDLGNSTVQLYAPIRYEWSPVLKGYILASFFYGYIVTQMPAAFLTTKYGGKLFFGGGIGICAILALATPAATYIGPTCLIFIRTLQGLAQGVIFTAMHALWSKWAPPSERSRMATFALAGSHIGTVVTFSIGGLIGKYIDWQAIFYVSGSIGMIWTVMWFYFISESPALHDTITAEEKNYIESRYVKNDNHKVIPWNSIFKSKAVWAIVIAHTAENWGIYTMLTEMTLFLAEIMDFKVDKAGAVAALPYLVMAIFLYLTGYISDLMSEQNMTFTFIRKLFCCWGLVAQAFFMLIIILSTNSTEIIICLMLSVGFGGMSWASFGVNHLDIGAGHANVLMAISNTFATIPGILSPILTGHITKDNTKEEWNIIFWISALIYLLGAIMYGFLGSGETQSWAFTSSTDTTETRETAFVFKDNEVNPLNVKTEKVGQNNTSYETIEK